MCANRRINSYPLHRDSHSHVGLHKWLCLHRLFHTWGEEAVSSLSVLMPNKALKKQHGILSVVYSPQLTKCWTYSSLWCGDRNQCSKVTVRVIYPPWTWSVTVINHWVLISDGSLLWLRNVHVIQFGTHCCLKNPTQRFTVGLCTLGHTTDYCGMQRMNSNAAKDTILDLCLTIWGNCC